MPGVRSARDPDRCAGGRSPDAVAAAAALLRDGAILAVKGLGGYHLACRADDEAAVAALRGRKQREDKPFALMVPDVAAAHGLVVLDAAGEALLRSVARPIVLALRRPGARVAAAVAPGMAELGVMLPYTPLHHLLLADAGCTLVMTSGNAGDEPIAYRDDDAAERLAPLADAFLVHDRPIAVRTDDSVVRVVRGRTMVLRRSRGLVPEGLALPVACAAPVVAYGAQLKSTFCVAKGARAWVGHHIGDLDEPRTRASFAEGVAHFERLFAVDPAIVAHDLHPDYASTALALERDGVRAVAVQHHHAHLAACLAEHGETGPGGRRDLRRLRARQRRHALGRRAARRRPARLPPRGPPVAGAPARRRPRGARALAHGRGVARGGRRPAAAAPARAARRRCRRRAGAPSAGWPSAASPRPRRRAPAGCSTPSPRSAGCARAAATRARRRSSWRRSPTRPSAPRYELPVTDDCVLDARPTIRAVLADAAAGTDPRRISARFHRAVARATAAACAQVAAAAGLDRVVLSGGVFQNRLLLEWTAAELEAAGLRVLVPERLPPNDGGISFGQAAIAAAGG